jgi:ribosomal protein L9
MEPEEPPGLPTAPPEVKVTVAQGQRKLTDFLRPAPAPRPPTEQELADQKKQREQKEEQQQQQQQADNAALLAHLQQEDPFDPNARSLMLPASMTGTR